MWFVALKREHLFIKMGLQIFACGILGSLKKLPSAYQKHCGRCFMLFHRHLYSPPVLIISELSLEFYQSNLQLKLLNYLWSDVKGLKQPKNLRFKQFENSFLTWSSLFIISVWPEREDAIYGEEYWENIIATDRHQFFINF